MKIHLKLNSNYPNAFFTEKNNRFLTSQQKRILSIYCLTMVIALAVSVSTLLYCVFKKEKKNLTDTTLKADKLKNILENKPVAAENATNAIQVPSPPIVDPLLVKKTATAKDLITLTNNVYVEMTKMNGKEKKPFQSGDWRFNSFMIGGIMQDAINEVFVKFMVIEDKEKFIKKKLDYITKYLNKKLDTSHSHIENKFTIPEIKLANSSDALLWKKHIYQNQLKMSEMSSPNYYDIMKNAFGEQGGWVSDTYQKAKEFSDQDLQEVEKFSQSIEDLFKSFSQHDIKISQDDLIKDLVAVKDEIKLLQQKIKVLGVAAQNIEKIMELAQDALPELIV